MNWLLVPYIINVVILIPIVLGSLFNLFPISLGHFPESDGWRTVSGSLWAAIFISSILGLFAPLVYSPILLLQVIYKIIWILVYVLPRIGKEEKKAEIHWSMTILFALMIILYSFIIPWDYLFVHV